MIIIQKTSITFDYEKDEEALKQFLKDSDVRDWVVGGGSRYVTYSHTENRFFDYGTCSKEKKQWITT